jgi:hypothetical protein
MPLCFLPNVDLETLYLLAMSVYVKVSHLSRLLIAASASSMRLILVELWVVGVGCNSLGLRFRRALRRSGRCADLHGTLALSLTDIKPALMQPADSQPKFGRKRHLHSPRDQSDRATMQPIAPSFQPMEHPEYLAAGASAVCIYRTLRGG